MGVHLKWGQGRGRKGAIIDSPYYKFEKNMSLMMRINMLLWQNCSDYKILKGKLNIYYQLTFKYL